MLTCYSREGSQWASWATDFLSFGQYHFHCLSRYSKITADPDTSTSLFKLTIFPRLLSLPYCPTRSWKSWWESFHTKLHLFDCLRLSAAFVVSAFVPVSRTRFSARLWCSSLGSWRAVRWTPLVLFDLRVGRWVRASLVPHTGRVLWEFRVRREWFLHAFACNISK